MTHDSQTQSVSLDPDLVVQMIPALRAFARSLTRNRDDADDLVQETLLKAIRYRNKFHQGTNLRAWLFTIMRNTFYTNIRKRTREPTGVEDCVASTVIVQATQDWTVAGNELMAAVDRLPDHFRQALLLVVALGESYEDAARICGCATGTIKSRVSRARALVMADLSPEPPEPEAPP
ncbi:sigma-70 family RNA polymerase sigma factor [Pseudooceanicola sediminis]|uniref:RNA polymerase sigma factor n=1 Tax=Pseudooceanicola sediminis TaxID=2211117 RepID=A0A399IXV8_9RHOB|nr:sigma-70 family RNA polymerase sigma factor [Pseudooceanicola sediminis]KAA2313163.1 sigma-70 family RNA polymerase sigma factor [Puniceibacterium sp. HSS470]RII37810.1 sigma-70 family RNA polymerase sigma factor [Pseudooceanicola sediminis]|tara:strand:- start:21059 stop:21589 length:531 start_codon:yes stop_codon:yes gene_type:complete